MRTEVPSLLRRTYRLSLPVSMSSRFRAIRASSSTSLCGTGCEAKKGRRNYSEVSRRIGCAVTGQYLLQDMGRSFRGLIATRLIKNGSPTVVALIAQLSSVICQEHKKSAEDRGCDQENYDQRNHFARRPLPPTAPTELPRSVHSAAEHRSPSGWACRRSLLPWTGVQPCRVSSQAGVLFRFLHRAMI